MIVTSSVNYVLMIMTLVHALGFTKFKWGVLIFLVPIGIFFFHTIHIQVAYTGMTEIFRVEKINNLKLHCDVGRRG